MLINEETRKQIHLLSKLNDTCDRLDISNSDKHSLSTDKLCLYLLDHTITNLQDKAFFHTRRVEHAHMTSYTIYCKGQCHPRVVLHRHRTRSWLQVHLGPIHRPQSPCTDHHSSTRYSQAWNRYPLCYNLIYNQRKVKRRLTESLTL